MEKFAKERSLVDNFNELIDDMGDVTIGGLNYQHSRVFKKIDPIAYKEGLPVYLDGLLSDGEITEEDIDNAIQLAFTV